MKCKLNPLSMAVKTAISMAVMSLPVIALAQDKPPTVEEVMVTGSLIKGAELDGAMQVIQISRKDIQESGAPSAAELLKELTQTGGGSGTFSSSSGGALSGQSPVGSGGVSLRGLGTASTLTLVNGRRAAVSSFANGQESFIDVNSIPSSAIERIEVLPSGASATYGADAVAGVVNIILRKDYEGSELSISTGDSTANTDEAKYNINWVWGTTTENSSTMVLVDAYTRNGFYDRDRDISKNSVRPSQQGIYPSFNDFYFNYYDSIQDGCPTDQQGFGEFGAYCEVNTNEYSSIDDDYESLGVVLTHDWQMSDTTSMFSEVLYQKYKSQGVSSPANMNRVAVNPNHPNFPQSLKNNLEDEGFANEPYAGLGFGGFDYYSGYPIYAYGKFPDGRGVEVETESYRLVVGFEGELNDKWNWEVAGTYGSSESEQRGISGLYLSQEFQDTLLGNVCTDGSHVENSLYVGDTNACEADGKETLWYNPFDGQTEQMAGIDEYIRTEAERNGESSTWSLDGVVSGPIFELAAGNVLGALGAEFRHEAVKDTPSGAAVATDANPEPIIGYSSTSVDGERDQYAIYGEAIIPVTEDLEMTLSARYDHYDDFGGDTNPKIGLRYQMTDQVILRSNWSTSFRAPSLAQSGAGTLLSSFTVNCADTPTACNGNGQANGLSLLSEDVGNPDLQPEEATTWGFGVVFQPTADIDISMDYWNIEHTDLIGIDEDDFLRRALAGEYPEYSVGELPTGVAGIETTNGFVSDAHFELTNLGKQTTSGIDFEYTQYIDGGSMGDFTLLFDSTYLDEFDREASDVSGVERLAGDYRYPRWLANAKIRWSLNNWSASLGANYTGSYKDDPAPRTLEAVGLPADAKVEVDSWTVWNLSVGYYFDNGSDLRVTVDNLFDKEPPLVLGTGANVDHINHSSLGQFVTMRYTHKF